MKNKIIKLRRSVQKQFFLVVTINGTFPNQEFIGVLLVAVPEGATDEETSMGHFQVGFLLLTLNFLSTVISCILKQRPQ